MKKATTAYEQTFFVPLTLPSLNEIILARSQSKTFKRKGKTIRVDNYQKLKKEERIRISNNFSNSIG